MSSCHKSNPSQVGGFGPHKVLSALHLFGEAFPSPPHHLTRHQVAVGKTFPPRDAHPRTQCDKTFTRGDNLRLHMKRHMTAQQFSCSDCTKIYASKSKLKLHTAKAHEDGETLVFKCSHCEFQSKNKWYLGQHMQRHTGK